jgi:hypothetical protein
MPKKKKKPGRSANSQDPRPTKFLIRSSDEYFATVDDIRSRPQEVYLRNIEDARPEGLWWIQLGWKTKYQAQQELL